MGFTNSFTSTTDTNFHLECNNDGFEGALDRFAQHFIDPLFDESLEEREKNVLHQKFVIAQQQDFQHTVNLM